MLVSARGHPAAAGRDGSGAVNVSRHHLTRLFRAHTGRTVPLALRTGM